MCTFLLGFVPQLQRIKRRNLSFARTQGGDEEIFTLLLLCFVCFSRPNIKRYKIYRFFHKKILCLPAFCVR